MMKIKSIAVSVILGMGSLSGYAQWSTQTMVLKPGWNAVYLHVDASYANINELEGLDENIEEIWLWKPQVSDAQFITTPDAPTKTIIEPAPQKIDKTNNGGHQHVDVRSLDGRKIQ